MGGRRAGPGRSNGVLIRTRTCTPERRNTKGHPLDALLVVRLFGVDRLRLTHERGADAALVVITTTPYDASGPYSLSAACPLITRTAEI